MMQRGKPRKRTPLKRSTKPMRARRAKPRRGPAGIPPDQWRNPGYRRFLREEGRCVPCTKEIAGLWPQLLPVCDPMHGPPNGRSQKGPDAGCIPGCRSHHEEQTRIGWPAFEVKYGFSREKEAAVWWTAFQIWKESQC